MMKKGKNKSRFFIIGSCLLLLTISFLSYHYISIYISNKIDDNLVKNYFVTYAHKDEENIKSNNTTSNEINYIGILEIPTINLKRGFLSLNDKNNNVNKNIEVLKNSTMPDEDKSLLAIAGHSGNGKRSYFKYLYKLNLNDKLFIYYKGIKYTYEIINKYDVPKDGDIEVVKSDKKMLVLTTCSQTDRTKQIVIVGNLINQESF